MNNTDFLSKFHYLPKIVDLRTRTSDDEVYVRGSAGDG